jgi:hypothetical protein
MNVCITNSFIDFRVSVFISSFPCIRTIFLDWVIKLEFIEYKSLKETYSRNFVPDGINTIIERRYWIHHEHQMYIKHRLTTLISKSKSIKIILVQLHA